MELSYDENVDILSVIFNAGSANGYTLSLGVFEISDINLMIKSLFLDEVKVKIKIDDFSLRSDLPNNKTVQFIGKFFFYSKLGFTQPHSGPLDSFEGFVQKIPGSNKRDQSSNLNGIDNY